MYIVAIAWGFVTILMAAAEAMSGSIVGGILSFIFYGVLPLALILYLFGTPQRRRDQLKQRLLKEEAEQKISAAKSASTDAPTPPENQASSQISAAIRPVMRSRRKE